MKEEVYDNILKNSKIAYLKLNCKKNENNKFVGINIIEQSEEAKNLFKILTDNNILNRDITELIVNNWINKNFKDYGFNDLMEEVIKTRYKRLKFTTTLKGKNVITDIYYLDDYFIYIFNIDYNTVNKENKMNIYSWKKNLDGVYLEFEYQSDKKIESLENIIGKKDKDIWSKNDIKQLKTHEQIVIDSKNVKTFYETLTTSYGKKLYLESTKWPLLNEKKEIIGIKALSVTIDDKLVFEKDIQKNEENFREIAQYSDAVFIIRDRNRAIYVSPSFEQIFEEKPDELYKDIDKLDDYYRKVAKNDYDLYYGFEYDKINEGVGKVKLKNGKIKWIWSKFLPIVDFDGTINKRIGILTDITEKKKIEEEKMQMKLNFFTNLSHELRTPINLISSTIQLIKLNLEKLSPQDENKFEKYVKIIEVNSLRLEKLINNLLDSRKIEEGFAKFNPISGDIISFIENICDSIVQYAEFNNMNLIFDTDREEEIVIFDPNIIERILLNLLSNAIKFNKKNGTIKVDVYTKDNKIKISVKDEGIGIPKEKINYIFKRFRQASEKDEKQGSGIGLYLVKSLVELHKGTIDVKSEVNKGSEFIVTIPKQESNYNENIAISNEELMNRQINVEFSDV